MDPHEILRRLRDDYDRWDGIEYRPPMREPQPRSSPWRRVTLAVVAGLAVGAVISGLAVGLNGTRGYTPSVTTSPPDAEPTITGAPTPIVPSPPPPPTSGIETGAELNNEYAWEALHFPRPLPEGVSYPNVDLDTEIDASYEVGLGAVDVPQFWVCSWETEYLRAADAGDESAEAAALRQVDAFATLSVTKRNFPDWHKEYDLYITPAKHGDFDPLRTDLGKGGCQ